jgi:light-regulated signal transduction histidine kinase (bacteriophytochrome)
VVQRAVTGMSPQTEQGEIEPEPLITSLAEFSARAGHDLLGPLNQASSLLALFIKRYRNQLDSEADHLLDFLLSASERMEGAVTGVRKYMEVTGSPPAFQTVDLNASLASALARLTKPIAESRAAIESDTLPVTMADAVQMAAMFEILIGNAIKFRKPDTAPCIRISSRPAGDSLGDGFVVAIADNGIGIDPAYQDAVFLPFKRLNGREYPGPGLGLATAKLIAGLHGGSIRIESAAESEAVDATCVSFTVRPA